MIDLYTILGVDRDATQEEIREAYRRGAMRLHEEEIDLHRPFAKYFSPSPWA